jgi:glucosamine--fructose-6-phosphate aminotransferase (isomerizing)
LSYLIIPDRAHSSTKLTAQPLDIQAYNHYNSLTRVLFQQKINPMCGIFGYIGSNPKASHLVLAGLKALEYRGYDSWGIAANNESRIIVEKHIGKIGNASLSSQISNLNSKIAIGHTRWATHGGVTDTNAHPHFDCHKQIAVIHNGIVENFLELKKNLIQKGHKFISETDTEIISHLIEENFKAHTSLADAVRESFNLLKGLNAIVVINTKTREIIAAKNGSPLIIGIDKNEFFIASDASAILSHTKKVVFLKDNELISINNHFQLFSLPSGKKLKPHIETIDWNTEQASIGKFAHFMLKEIYEQPAIINSLSATYPDQIKNLSKVIIKAKGTFLIGSGTAYHACLAGAYLFSKIAGIHINTAPASEFNYLEDFLTRKSLIIPLSQSGETIDVVEPLTSARKKGSQIMSITNTLGSTIYRLGNHKLLLGAGPEKAVASTKAYIAKITILTMFAYTLADKLSIAQKILQESSKEIKRILENKSITKIKTIAKFLSTRHHVYIIGRGVSYATALEGALKIKEVSYIHTEGLAGGELKHGTIALISKGTPCIVIAPKDETHDAIISNAIEIKSRGGYIIGISSEDNPAFDEWIQVNETGSPLLTQIIPLQLLAYYIAVHKNLDPDKPRNLAKSVTVK